MCKNLYQVLLMLVRVVISKRFWLNRFATSVLPPSAFFFPLLNPLLTSLLLNYIDLVTIVSSNVCCCCHGFPDFPAYYVIILPHVCYCFSWLGCPSLIRTFRPRIKYLVWFCFPLTCKHFKINFQFFYKRFSEFIEIAHFGTHLSHSGTRQPAILVLTQDQIKIKCTIN